MRFSDLILGLPDNGSVKREGLLPERELAWSLWFLFFLQLWLLYFLLSWFFFRVLSWLQFCLDKSWILRGRLVVFFVVVLGWRFRCSLGCCFGLCFLCSWGPGTRIGSCMVVSVPLSYDFGCYFLRLMKHRWLPDCLDIPTCYFVSTRLC